MYFVIVCVVLLASVGDAKMEQRGISSYEQWRVVSEKPFILHYDIIADQMGVEEKMEGHHVLDCSVVAFEVFEQWKLDHGEGYTDLPDFGNVFGADVHGVEECRGDINLEPGRYALVAFKNSPYRTMYIDYDVSTSLDTNSSSVWEILGNSFAVLLCALFFVVNWAAIRHRAAREAAARVETPEPSGVDAEQLARRYPARTLSALPEDGPEDCAICLDEVGLGDQVRVFECRHYYHVPCIDRWLVDHTACPLCKRDLAAGEEERPPFIRLPRFGLGNLGLHLFVRGNATEGEAGDEQRSLLANMDADVEAGTPSSPDPLVEFDMSDLAGGTAGEASLVQPPSNLPATLSEPTEKPAELVGDVPAASDTPESVSTAPEVDADVPDIVPEPVSNAPIDLEPVSSPSPPGDPEPVSNAPIDLYPISLVSAALLQEITDTSETPLVLE